jgi:putative spermidine/putrescine transport system permease protein
MTEKIAGRMKRVWRLGVVAMVCALAATPLALLGLRSFAHEWFWPALLPQEWSLRAWSYVFAPAADIIDALWMSLAIASIVTLLAATAALPAARALAMYEFRFKRILVFALLLPVLAPSLAATMGMHSLFLRLGLADTIPGVVLSHMALAVPYATLTLAGSFSRFDRDLEAQARTLGASRLRVWRYITIPSILPGLAVATSFAFLISWSQYLTTMFIGGGRIVTLPLKVVAFQRGGDEAVAAALSLVFLFPALLVLGAVGRLMSKGDDFRG